MRSPISRVSSELPRRRAAIFIATICVCSLLSGSGCAPPSGSEGGAPGGPGPSVALSTARLTNAWTWSASSSVDGISLADLDGDGKLEVVAIVREVQPFPARVVALNANGTERWTYVSATKIGGVPAVGDFDGDGADEVAFCEISGAGMCRVLDGDGTELFAVGPFAYPGMSGGAAGAADINGDGAADLIVSSWGGIVAGIDGRTGVELWRYDAWTARGENLHGVGAVGDLDGDGDLEVVLGGSYSGSIIALNAATGTEVWVVPDLWTAMGNYFFGNGLLLVDLDRNGTLEVVASLIGTEPAIVAYSSTGSLLWRTPIPSAVFDWQTPVAADLDVNGTVKIVSQDRNGVLRVLNAAGSVVASTDLGQPSWGPPSFVDVNGDMRPEIVALGENSVIVLNGQTLAELDRFDWPNSGIMPDVLVADLDRDGSTELVVGAWNAAGVRRLDLGVPGLYRWSSLGRDGRHGSWLNLGASLDANDAVELVDTQQNKVEALIAAPSTPPAVKTALQNLVLPKVNGSTSAALAGDISVAISNLRDGTRELANITGYDTSGLQRMFTFTALRLFEELVDRAAAMMKATHAAVVAARQQLSASYASFYGASYVRAAQRAGSAALTLVNALMYVGEHCSANRKERYLGYLCRTQTARGAVVALNAGSPDPNFATAQSNLEAAVLRLTKRNGVSSLQALQQAVAALSLVTSTSTTLVQASLAETAREVSRSFIDDVIRSGFNPAGVAAAEVSYASGVASLSTGSYKSAVLSFHMAATQAAP